jgi:hypothetical protein
MWEGHDFEAGTKHTPIFKIPNSSKYANINII